MITRRAFLSLTSLTVLAVAFQSTHAALAIQGKHEAVALGGRRQEAHAFSTAFDGSYA